MATASNFLEEECFNVYWKIKNFSYCTQIESSEFALSMNLYRLRLLLRDNIIECGIEILVNYALANVSAFQISFVTCDGSSEESNSGDIRTTLRVPRNVIFEKRRNSFLPDDTLTVQLRYPTNNERGKVFIYSRVLVKRKYFLWTFKNFKNFANSSRKYVEHSTNYGTIELIFKSTTGNNSTEDFNIEIFRISGESCNCVLKIQILDKDGKAQKEMSDKFTLSEMLNPVQSQSKVLALIIKKKKLLARGNLLLPNDTLTLKCEFSISLGKVTDQTVVTSYCADITPLQEKTGDSLLIVKEITPSNTVTELQADFKRLLEDGTLCDVCLQIGSEIIQAHKNILSARSCVFKAMFGKDSKETITGTVVIDGLDSETVQRMLLYIYTDLIQDDEWERMKKLYFAADKYGIQSLKRKCVSAIKSNFSAFNVCEALLLSDEHQDEELKTAALGFISENDSVVFASDTWRDLEKNNNALACRVLREICCNYRCKE